MIHLCTRGVPEFVTMRRSLRDYPIGVEYRVAASR